MKGILRTGRRMEKELLNGLMELNTLEVGDQGNNMALVFYIILLIIRRGKENGATVNDYVGLVALKCYQHLLLLRRGRSHLKREDNDYTNVYYHY